MKLISVLVAASVLLPATAFAASKSSYRYNYGLAGCGLGSVLVDTPDRYGDKVFQVLAGIVNELLWTQTFGITSGTSNCEGTPSGIARMEQEVYLKSNLAALEKEAAKGEGEHLFAFADVLGCASQSDSFATLSQTRHQKIFKDSNPKAVLDRYVSEIHSYPALAAHCTRVQ